jgi:DNA polymerase elongation subunit (family B)
MLKRPKIKSVHYFAKTINFKPYVDHFFKIKQDAPDGSAARQMAKLLLNSAYGRYGIDGSKFLEYIVVAPDKIDETHATTKYRYLCRAANWALMAREVDETRQTYHNVATAASVTGFVRAYLLRAYKKSGGVAYMDTDSLVCKNFVGKVGVDLGQWKHEFTATRSAFYAKKGYALTNGKKEKLASKGARLTRAEIFKLARGEQVEYFQAAPTMGIKTGVKFISRKINNTNVKKAAQ